MRLPIRLPTPRNIRPKHQIKPLSKWVKNDDNRHTTVTQAFSTGGGGGGGGGRLEPVLMRPIHPLSVKTWRGGGWWEGGGGGIGGTDGGGGASCPFNEAYKKNSALLAPWPLHHDLSKLEGGGGGSQTRTGSGRLPRAFFPAPELRGISTTAATRVGSTRDGTRQTQRESFTNEFENEARRRAPRGRLFVNVQIDRMTTVPGPAVRPAAPPLWFAWLSPVLKEPPPPADITEVLFPGEPPE